MILHNEIHRIAYITSHLAECHQGDILLDRCYSVGVGPVVDVTDNGFNAATTSRQKDSLAPTYRYDCEQK